MQQGRADEPMLTLGIHEQQSEGARAEGGRSRGLQALRGRRGMETNQTIKTTRRGGSSGDAGYQNVGIGCSVPEEESWEESGGRGVGREGRRNGDYGVEAVYLLIDKDKHTHKWWLPQR